MHPSKKDNRMCSYFQANSKCKDLVYKTFMAIVAYNSSLSMNKRTYSIN